MSVDEHGPPGSDSTITTARSISQRQVTLNKPRERKPYALVFLLERENPGLLLCSHRISKSLVIPNPEARYVEAPACRHKRMHSHHWLPSGLLVCRSTTDRRQQMQVGVITIHPGLSFLAIVVSLVCCATALGSHLYLACRSFSIARLSTSPVVLFRWLRPKNAFAEGLSRYMVWSPRISDSALLSMGRLRLVRKDTSGNGVASLELRRDTPHRKVQSQWLVNHS